MPVLGLGMDKETLKQRLAEVGDHIALGRQHIAQQLKIIAEIERRHGDSTSARQTLHTIAQTQLVHLDDRDRLMRMLEGVSEA
jgi:hypothetical protein